MFNVRPKDIASMFTRDGVRLDADIYRPDDEGSFPVLLMRQPYGRAIASTIVYAHPIWYAAHGYIVVIQDVRGRGTSEGNFKLFAHEIEDGEDTVHWAATLAGSNGQVGMYGFSYQGMTQLYAAAAKPPALKTICPAMIGYDLYTDWAYEGGAFCLQANLSWAIQLAAETARLKGDVLAHQTLAIAARNLPLYDSVPTRASILEQFDPDSFYFEWLQHSEPDDYWEDLSPKTYLQNIDLPMLHIGGWFDTFLRGTMHLYKEMAARSAYRQQLLVGAWAHLPWGRKVGAIDFGAEASSPCDRLQVRWFDQFLKGLNTGLLDEPAINLFEMGSNQWRSFDTWHAPKPTPYFLASTGLASISDQEGTLTPSPPHSLTPSSDFLIHDPWRPVPALGGHASAPSGPQERSSLDCRTDILTYTSQLLEEDLHLAGDVSLLIHCTADTPSFDLCAVLSEVRPDGNVYNVTQGYVRVAPGQATTPLRIILQPICVCVSSGKAIRLSLSAACFPAYPVNAGTGSPAGETRLIDQQIITVTVQSGGDRPSQILLPVIARRIAVLLGMATLPVDENQVMNSLQNVSPISVRVLTPADAEAYRSVRLRALHEQPPAFGSLPEDEPNLSETAARLAESDDRCFFGAFQDEQLIGIIRLSRYAAPNEKHRAYLAGLYVLSPFRCYGCGRALVRKALSRAATAPEIRRVNLTVVTQQEAAIRLYQSFGFRIYGTEQETFSRNGQFYDEHLMTLELIPEVDYNA